MAKKPQDVSLKLLVLGASGTGKTRFIERYCRGSYNSTAVGDVTIKIVKIKGIRFTISLWDTSNQQLIPAPGNATPTSFVARGAHGAIVLYDVTSMESLYDAQQDIVQFSNSAMEEARLLLVGNKSDLAVESRAVSIRDAGAFAREHNMIGVLEVSVKKNRGLEQAVDLLIEKIHNELLLKDVEGSVAVGGQENASSRQRRRSKCVCS